MFKKVCDFLCWFIPGAYAVYLPIILVIYKVYHG